MKKATVQDTVTEYLEQLYTNLFEHGFHDAGIQDVSGKSGGCSWICKCTKTRYDRKRRKGVYRR